MSICLVFLFTYKIMDFLLFSLHHQTLSHDLSDEPNIPVMTDRDPLNVVFGQENENLNRCQETRTSQCQDKDGRN